MFKMNKELRNLGIVSVSALMLLGVGAGMSNAQHPVHADNIAAEGAAQDRRYDDYLFGGSAGAKAHNEMMAKRDVKEAISDGDDPYDATSERILGHSQIAKMVHQSKQDNHASSNSSNASTSSASASDNAVAPSSASSAPASASTDDVPAMPAITTGGTPEAKTQHKVTTHKSHSRKARPVMKPRVRRHHARVAKFSHKKVNRSLKHDVIYVNRVNRKRHVRKNIAKRVHNVKRQVRRTRKSSKRANLQREIKNLKRQLRRAHTWRSRRSIRHQINKLTKQYNAMFGKRANKRDHKMNKRAYRHARKHAKRSKRNHALKYNGYRE